MRSGVRGLSSELSCDLGLCIVWWFESGSGLLDIVHSFIVQYFNWYIVS
jgi:hypothetical protein